MTAQSTPVLWRIQAQAGALPENLTMHLDSFALYPGIHRGPITISPDGAWYVFLSERFDSSSQGWAGLTIAHADFQTIETIQYNGQTVHGEGGQATAGGAVVVYVDGGGPHSRDLFLVERQGNSWTTPVCLTTQSPYVWNYWPVLSRDSAKFVFDVSADSSSPFPSTAICEVRLNGSGFRVLITKDNGPPGFSPSPAVHSPAFASDGGLVFEAEWGGSERVWHLSPGDSIPALVNQTFTNDNSPNVLPDGRIVSLWLGSSTGDGLHEIKLMDANGQNYVMLTDTSSPFPEVDDIGLGCGPSFGVTSAKAGDNFPTGFVLQQNFPNPFNPQTRIEFSVPHFSYVKVTVYDVLGKAVALLVNEKRPAGTHEVTWNALGYASGVYIYRLEAFPTDIPNAELMTETKKLMLVK